MNIKDYNDLFAILTAIGTIGMCLCSFLNIRFTRKQATYQSKIIDTKNLLYSILCLERNFILTRIQIYTEILECFIYLYILKKEQIDKTTFKCYFEFENQFTTPVMKEKIKTCFSCLKSPAKTPEETYQYCKNLIEIIKFYFSKNDNFEANLLNTFFITICSLLSRVVDDKLNTKQLFFDYIMDCENCINDINLYRYNKCFAKFYIPTYQQEIAENKRYLKQHQYIMMQDKILSIFDAYCEFLVDTYDKKMSYIEKYNILHKRLQGNLNDDVVNRLISDLGEDKFYYLQERNFIIKYFLIGKQKYYFWKITGKISYNKKNFETPSLFAKRTLIYDHYFELKLISKENKPTVK